jgi:hypothetical protein
VLAALVTLSMGGIYLCEKNSQIDLLEGCGWVGAMITAPTTGCCWCWKFTNCEICCVPLRCLLESWNPGRQDFTKSSFYTNCIQFNDANASQCWFHTHCADSCQSWKAFLTHCILYRTVLANTVFEIRSTTSVPFHLSNLIFNRRNSSISLKRHAILVEHNVSYQ